MTKQKQTKIDLVRKMLARPEGTTLDAICEATGWQAHSARAVLSGLRKAGYEVEREAADDGKGAGSRYRIKAAPEGVA